jgi:hypothetical protein
MMLKNRAHLNHKAAMLSRRRTGRSVSPPGGRDAYDLVAGATVSGAVSGATPVARLRRPVLEAAVCSFRQELNRVARDEVLEAEVDALSAAVEALSRSNDPADRVTVPVDHAGLAKLVLRVNALLAAAADRTAARAEACAAQARATLGRKVAHDIRSPLSALEVACTYLTALPAPHRALITDAVRRIESVVGRLGDLPSSDGLAAVPPSLSLIPGSRVVVLDDDAFMAQVWRERFASANHLRGISLHVFQRSGDFAAYVAEHRHEVSLCLLDFELEGEAETGPDVAARLGLASRSVVITSRDTEREVQHRCAALGLRLLPKGCIATLDLRVADSLTPAGSGGAPGPGDG